MELPNCAAYVIFRRPVELAGQIIDVEVATPLATLYRMNSNSSAYLNLLINDPDASFASGDSLSLFGSIDSGGVDNFDSLYMTINSFLSRDTSTRLD